MKAIFIIGEQRSGSNLLRLMLSQAGIAAPHPPHILKRMLPLEPSYGDLTQDPNWQQLIEDVCELVDRNPVPWDNVLPLDRAEVQSRCRDRSTVAIFGSIMDMYAEARGASAWACKSMGYSDLVEPLEAYFEGAKYIYLYRDGRDVALSFRRAVVGEKHPYFSARKWARLQRSAMRVRDIVGPERHYAVCYEELTAEPEPVLRGLCDFLGVPFASAMMDFHRSTDARSAASSSQLWQNVRRPLMRNNSRKFLTGLSEAEIRICESVAGAELDRLGYERVHIEKGAEDVYSPEMIASFAEENERLKADNSAGMDSGDAERRAHQLAILTERVQYFESLTQAQKTTLLAYVDEQHLEPSAVLAEQGQTSDALYFVVAGQLEVLDGAATIATLERGACAGEVGLLSGAPRTRTLRTAGGARVLRLAREDMVQMIDEAPALAARLLWSIGATLADRFAKVSQ